MNKKLKRILKNTVPLVIYLVFCFAVNAYAEDMDTQSGSGCSHRW